jgi:hypothetical protein
VPARSSNPVSARACFFRFSRYVALRQLPASAVLNLAGERAVRAARSFFLKARGG